jgi:Uma2 family endonuclease
MNARGPHRHRASVAAARIEAPTEQAERCEFVAGEVFAMTGGSVKHATVVLNIGMALRRHLRGTSCRTFLNDVKLRVDSADAYCYPDVMVTCSPADARDPLIQREPLLLVEVLSPSSASYDRGGKFAAYRSLPTLREVLLVDPDARSCDLFRLGERGLWKLRPAARTRMCTWRASISRLRQRCCGTKCLTDQALIRPPPESPRAGSDRAPCSRTAP